ncbi:hypothetical protein ACIQWR_23725 [Streptomyces sp. NPDC098789]|uniref:Lsr2 family DNA-binding protein n=1 Tax=Streptomyces sp. NPDC098789 TaxID=3366098 RepID=UPI00382860E7
MPSSALEGFEGVEAFDALVRLCPPPAAPTPPSDWVAKEGVCFTPSPELRPGDAPRIVTVTWTARHCRIHSTDALRVWARANGYELPPRGRIPHLVFTAWKRAHSEG